LCPLAAAVRLKNHQNMTENFAFDSLTALLTTEFAVPADTLGPDTRLADLDLDSVGLVELAVALEERFDVDLTTGHTAITMQDRIGDLVARLTAGHPTAR
jgi:acyl carrier protein